MPLYEYRCVKCRKLTEKIEKLNGPHLKKCPHCGAKVEPMVSAPAIQFKGTGWYVTDYARKGSGGDSGKSDSGSSKSDSAKADSGNSDGDKSEGGGKSEKRESSSEVPTKDTKKKAGPAPKPS